MRILIHTRFYPNVGGIETVAGLLVHEWVRAGQDVTVVSDVHCPPQSRQSGPFSVYYRPRVLQWLRLMSRADIFVHMNISLKALWPAWILRRPFVAVHHGCYFVSRKGDRDWKERLKLKYAKRAH